MRCLVISSPGKKGHMRQAQAVAARLGAVTTTVEAPRARRDVAQADYDVVIAAGRQAIAPARRIAKRRTGPRPVVAVLQPVIWHPADFDLIWAPSHDRAARRLAARTPLVETLTAPSAVTAADMAEAAAELGAVLTSAAPPYVGVLVGGPSRAHRFARAEVEELATRLGAFATAHDVRILLTTSQRSPAGAAALFREVLPAPGHFVFDAADPGQLSPSRVFAAILGLAEVFVVTEDSVAMMSEAAATGKPIYGWHLPGGKAKFDRFHRGLEAHGALRWFDGGYERWNYPPLDAAGAIAEALLPRLDLAEGSNDRI